MHAYTPAVLSSPRVWRGMLCLLLCALVAACGFRMKGISPLPFQTIYTNIDENTEFGAGLRRMIVASSPGTRFVADPQQSQVRLIQLANYRRLRDVSLDAQGRVEEYELNLEFVFQLLDAQGRVLLAPTTLRATREIPYDDTVVQAKESEIETVFRDLETSLINGIVRRLSSPEVQEAYLGYQNAAPATSEPSVTAPVSPSRVPQSPFGGARSGPAAAQPRY